MSNELASLSIEEILGIAKGYLNPPTIPACVYFLLREGLVIYIGKTTDLVARAWDHRRSKVFDSVRYIPVPEGSGQFGFGNNLSEVEEALIRLIGPPDNRCLKGQVKGSEDYFLRVLNKFMAASRKDATNAPTR